MTNNVFAKYLLSLPVILVVIYFMPVLGILMLIPRKILIGNTKWNTGITFVVISCILLIPKVLEYIRDTFKIESIPYLNDILENDVYSVLLSRAKLLFIIGVIFVIIGAITKKTMQGIKNTAFKGLTDYFNNLEARDAEIAEKNDLKMREKQVAAKNTHFVHCPHCGASNTIIGDTGKCSYCKQTLQAKK